MSDGNGFFELRHYTCHEGQRDRWVDYMEKVIIPFQVSKGMVICGSFVGEEDDVTYYWIRRFEDEAERERFWLGRKSAFPAAGRIAPDYYVMDGTIPRARLGEVLGKISLGIDPKTLL